MPAATELILRRPCGERRPRHCNAVRKGVVPASDRSLFCIIPIFARISRNCEQGTAQRIKRFDVQKLFEPGAHSPRTSRDVGDPLNNDTARGIGNEFLLACDLRFHCASVELPKLAETDALW